ncbi:hypothetical protein amrb99_36550 [Actinomadura sp. RB99]|nr:hypothetical protein [Actinomadura sp. RB99]
MAKVLAHQGAMRAVLALDVLTLLVAPAMLAVARLARQGAPRLALAGGWIAGAGWLAGVVGLLPLDAVLYEAAVCCSAPRCGGPAPSPGPRGCSSGSLR